MGGPPIEVAGSRRRTHLAGMAKNSSDGSSLRKPGRGGNDEGWKTAPSRETTHDDPAGKDAAIEKGRKPLENAPGLVPDKDEGDGQRR
jgi:hypothetical protein